MSLETVANVCIGLLKFQQQAMLLFNVLLIHTVSLMFDDPSALNVEFGVCADKYKKKVYRRQRA